MNGSDVPERRWPVYEKSERARNRDTRSMVEDVGGLLGSVWAHANRARIFEVMPVEDHTQVVADQEKRIEELTAERDQLRVAHKISTTRSAEQAVQINELRSQRAQAREEMERLLTSAEMVQEETRGEPWRAIAVTRAGTLGEVIRLLNRLTATPCSDQGGDAHVDQQAGSASVRRHVTGGGPEPDGGLAPATSIETCRRCGKVSCAEEREQRLNSPDPFDEDDDPPDPSSSDQEGEGAVHKIEQGDRVWVWFCSGDGRAIEVSNIDLEEFNHPGQCRACGDDLHGPFEYRLLPTQPAVPVPQEGWPEQIRLVRIMDFGVVLNYAAEPVHKPEPSEPHRIYIPAPDSPDLGGDRG